MGLFVQPRKCLAWALFGLPPKFVPPTKLCCPPYDIGMFGIPFGSTFFFFFLLEVLNKDVWHVNVLLKLGDV